MRFIPLLTKTLPVFAAVFLATVFVGPSYGQTVSVIRNFNDGVNESSFAPPDSDGTVGPSDFIEFINSRFIVFDKTTSHTKRLDITDTAFWQGVNNAPGSFPGLTDTHVIYDYNSQRYFAVEITYDPNNSAFTNNQVFIARTNAPGADPTVLSNWTATSYTGRSSRFADYPMVGIDANALYISTNNFTAGGSASDRTLTSIPKSDLLLSTPSVANKSSTNRTSSGDSPQPVMDFSATKGAGVFVGVPNTINNSTSLVYTKVTGTGAAGATFGTASNVTVPTFNVSANYAPQPDGTFQLDNGDGRMPFRGYQVGDDIWLAQAVAGTGGASQRSAVEWYRLNYNSGGTPTLIASGLLQDTTGHFDYFNPSIAANVNGDVVISVTRSGDSTTGTSGRAGAYAFVGFTSGSTTTFGSETLLQAGLTNGYHLFGGTGERWGDYSAVSVDPNDQGDFWLINEYAVNSSTWANNISALSIHRSVIWNGAGTDNNWSTKPDWDFLPTNDDDLTFAGTTRLSPSNDSLSRAGFITFSNTAGAFTLSGNALTIAGGITNNSTSTQTIGLNLTLSAAQQFNAASGNLLMNGALDNGGNALTVTGTSNTTLAGSVSGVGSLTKIGGGTLVLSGNNSYSGGTTLTNGTIQLGHAAGLGSATGRITINGGTLDLNALGPTVGALNGSGGAIKSNVAGAASVTVGNGGAGGSYAGQIQNGSGTVAFIKSGAGTQTLSGNNSYSGGTTVTGGTLQMGHVNALGANTGALTVNTGGTLDLHGFSPTAGALNGTGGAVQSNVAGSVALTVGNGGANGSYAGVIQNGSGTLSLLKSSAGTQTLSGNNTYSGGTTVSGGTLIAGHVHALGTGGLTIQNTATSQLQSGLAGPVQLPSLTIDGGASPTATLDITDNNLIVHNGNLATLTAQAKSGINIDGALWTGPGITSSTAAADASGLTAVGIIPNDINGNPLYSTWPEGADASGAVSVTTTDDLIKFTYFGDADLNGVVDNDTDLTLWSNGFTSNGALTGWLWGDFDYSGTINNDTDLTLWSLAFTGQGAPLVAGGVQPVPEPSTFLLAAMGLICTATGVFRRRPMDCMKR